MNISLSTRFSYLSTGNMYRVQTDNRVQKKGVISNKETAKYKSRLTNEDRNLNVRNTRK